MNKIRELRKAKGLTMKELGNLVNVAESTISFYERGIHEPDFKTMSQLASTLGVTVEELMAGESQATQTETDKNIAVISGHFLRLSLEDQQRVLDFAAGILSARGQ